MSEIVLLGADHNRPLAMLASDERYIAESLLKAAPNYRYELSGLPKLDPPPAPRPEAAAAAAKVMMGQVAAPGLTVARLLARPYVGRPPVMAAGIADRLWSVDVV